MVKRGRVKICWDLLFLGRLVAVGQVTTVRQVKTHETVVWPHKSLVHLEVGGAAAQALYVHSPFLRVDVESLESSLLAEQLDFVDMLVAAVVSGTGIAFRVLVAHGRAKGIEDGTRGDIFRGDEEDGLPLTLDLFFLAKSAKAFKVRQCSAYHDLSNIGIAVHQGLLHQLRVLLEARL